TVEAAAAAEDVTAGKPTDEDKLIRLRDVEMFAIHFSMGNFELFRQPGGNGVASSDDPVPFLLTGLAPFKVAGGAHEPDEDFGEVARMENDQAHPIFNDPLLNAVDDFVADAVVRFVTPPDEDVGRIKHLFAEAVFRLFQGRRLHGELRIAQIGSNGPMNALRIEPGNS